MLKRLKRHKIAIILIIAILLLTACNMTIMLSAPIPFLESDPTPTQEVVIQPTVTPGVMSSGYIGVVTVTGSLVNIRAEPTLNSDSVGKVKAGVVIPMVVCCTTTGADEWVRIEYNHEERWIIKSLVKITYF